MTRSMRPFFIMSFISGGTRVTFKPFKGVKFVSAWATEYSRGGFSEGIVDPGWVLFVYLCNVFNSGAI